MEIAGSMNFMRFWRLLGWPAKFAALLVLFMEVGGASAQADCVASGTSTNCLDGGSVMLVSLTNSVTVNQGMVINIAVAPVIVPGQTVVTTSYSTPANQGAGPLPPWVNGLFAGLIFVSGMLLIKKKRLGESVRFWCWFAFIATTCLLAPETLAQTCPATSVTNSTLPLILSTNWTVNGPGNFTANGSGCNAIFSTTNLGSGTVTYTAIWLSSCDQSLHTNSTLVPYTVVAPPAITGQPSNQIVNLGNNATNSITVTGTLPLSYQWRFNRTNISDETNAVLSIINFQLANAGSYSVAVSNQAGFVVSSVVIMTSTNSPLDSDGNGLPDWWQVQYFGHIGVDPSADPDGDGTSNLQEYLNGTDPLDYYNGNLPNISVISGNRQTGLTNEWLTLPVIMQFTDTNSTILTNAPLTFSVTRGQALLSLSSNGVTSSLLELTTDTNGQAAVWMQLPGERSVNVVTVSAFSGPNVSQASFYEIAKTSGIVPMLAVGAERVMQLTTNGDLVSSGGNTAGELGDYTHLNSTNAVHVIGLTNIINIASGTACSLALDMNGMLWAWGDNQAGQLGNGATESTDLPVPVLGMSNVIAIAANYESYGGGGGGGGGTMNTIGGSGTLMTVNSTAQQTGLDPVAVKMDGTVWAWGGYPGSIPMQVYGVSNAISASAGQQHTLALMADGTVLAWGANWAGQLGNGTWDYSDTPVSVSGLSNIVAICAGDNHSLALDDNGCVWAWGDNFVGQLGNGEYGEYYDGIFATLVMSNVVQIAAGTRHSLALDTSGQVWAWGNYRAYQLGNSDTTFPSQLSGLTNIIAIAAGMNVSAALAGNGNLWQWGGVSYFGNNSWVWGDKTGLPTQVSKYMDFYNGQLPSLNILEGNQQQIYIGEVSAPFVLQVTDANGLAMANAPVSVEIFSGDVGLQIGGITNSTGLRLTSDSKGNISFWAYASPNAVNTNCVIKVLAESREEYVELDLTASLTPLPFSTDLASQVDLWYQADSLNSLNDGSAVNIWRGSVNVGRDANVEIDSLKLNPIIIHNVVNGRPVVHFQNGNSMQLPDFLGTNSEAEMFAVLRSTQITNQSNEPWQLGGSTLGGSGYPGVDGRIAEDFGSLAVHNIGVLAQPLDEFHLFNVSAVNGKWTARINGGVILSTTDNTFGAGGQPGTLPRTLGGGPSAGFTGDIAELITFNRHLRQTERVAIETYLNGKYAFVLNAPLMPSNLGAQAVSAQQIVLRWDAIPENVLTYYVVERRGANDNSYIHVGNVLNTNTFTDNQLAAGTQYYYRVKAVNLSGESPYTGEVGAQTLASGGNFPLPNVGLWLIADSISGLTDGMPIGIWPNLGSHDNDAIQLTSSNQPSFYSNVLNGRSAVRFDGTGEALNLTNFMAGWNQAELFVVLQAATNSVQGQRAWNFGSSDVAAQYPDAMGNIVDDFGSTTIQEMPSPSQITQPHIYNISADNGDWDARIDGVLVYSAETNSFGAATVPVIGALTNCFAGDIFEIVVFNHVLTTSEREKVNGYLNQKYLIASNSASPTNLNATAVSSCQVSLTWDSSGGSVNTAFQVERKTGLNGNYAVVATIQDGTSFVDVGLWPETEYYYRVSGLTFAGQSGYSNETNATTLAYGGSLPLDALTLWLKADAGVVSIHSNGVAVWRDQSGNGNDATTVSGQPVLVSAELGDRPAIYFEGTNSCFALPNIFSNTVSAEAFVVLKAREAVPSAPRSLWQLGSSGLSEAYPNTDGTLADDFGSAVMRNAGSPVQPIDQYHLYNVVSVTNEWINRINGKTQFEDTNNSPVFTNSFFIGKSGAPDTFFAGDIAEVLVFNRALSEAEREVVGLYLNQKYTFTTNAPTAPINLSLAVADAYSITLTWIRSSTNETSFQIERQIGNGLYIPIAVVPSGVTYYTDTNLTVGLSNSYRVKAKNYGGDSPYSNTVIRPANTNGGGNSSVVMTTGNNNVINLKLYTPLQ